MNYMEQSTCILRKGSELTIPIPLVGKLHHSFRDDQDNEECRASRAATTIANMRKSDGTPDMALYAFAANLYKASTPTLREFMDKMFKQQGMSIEQVQFDIKRHEEAALKEREPLACSRTDAGGWKCAPRQVENQPVSIVVSPPPFTRPAH